MDQKITESDLFIQDGTKGGEEKSESPVEDSDWKKKSISFVPALSSSPFSESVIHWLLL